MSTRHNFLLSVPPIAARMLDAEFEVCTDCGLLHMEGAPAPAHVDECAVCGGRIEDVELDDLVGL